MNFSISLDNAAYYKIKAARAVPGAASAAQQSSGVSRQPGSYGMTDDFCSPEGALTVCRCHICPWLGYRRVRQGATIAINPTTTAVAKKTNCKILKKRPAGMGFPSRSLGTRGRPLFLVDISFSNIDTYQKR